MEQLEEPICSYYLPDEGLKILLVGDDAVTALIQALSPPHYHLTGCVNATSAFELLLGGQLPAHSSYDLVLSDIFLPDMDGFVFIREQCFKTNIPHVAICGESLSDVRAAFRHGACYVLRRLYITKIELINLWQNVYRKREQCRSNETDSTTAAANSNDNNNNNSVANGDHHQHNGLVIWQQHQRPGANSNNIGNDNEFMNNVGDPSLRRGRVIWNERLESIFVNAVNQLGGEEDAKPKAILKAMNVPFLNRGHVASHLQKYRMKKNADKRRHPFGQRETDAMIYYPPPENPNTEHLLEPSTTDFHHLMQWQRQMHMEPIEENFGPVVPAMPSSLLLSGSNMQRPQDVTQYLVGSMQQVEQFFDIHFL